MLLDEFLSPSTIYSSNVVSRINTDALYYFGQLGDTSSAMRSAFARVDSSDSSRRLLSELSRVDGLTRVVHKLIGEGRTKIDLLALRDQIALILDIEHRLGRATGH